jgi:hypothetical protein
MGVTAPLSARAVRQKASEAVGAVESLGKVVNANAQLLNRLGERVGELYTKAEHLYRVPTVHSTFWQRLRWLVRGT